MRISHFVLLLVHIYVSYSLPNGAPTSACYNMLPVHGGAIPPLTSKSLFSVEPERNRIGQQQSLRLDIVSTIADLSFKGFMIQVRYKNRTIGSFLPSSDNSFKTIDCESSSDTVTHTNTQLKKSLTLEWKPPTDFLGQVVIQSTIAQDYDKFWVDVLSSSIEVERENVDDDTGRRISTTREPLLTYTFNNRNANNSLSVKTISDQIYDDCGDKKTCFGIPNGCIVTKSCSSFSAVKVQGSKYTVEMLSQKQAAYIAVGLSSDDKMGNDLVIECINDAGVKAFTSWTTVGSGKFDASRNGVPQNIINLKEGRIENGMINCQVELREEVFEVKSTSFDLGKNKYYLLLASGTKLRPFSVDYHDITRSNSDQAIALSDISNIAEKSKFLLRLHGSLMIIAWLGATSIGILLARYFKMTWRKNSVCSKDVWFAWHRILMTLTFLLTLIAIIAIFLEIRGWSTSNNLHVFSGITTAVLCLFQALIGTLRPSPSSKSRVLFNWVHFVCGNAAHILAILTIFSSAKLEKAELPTDFFDLTLIGYVVVYLIAHGFLSVFSCMSERQNQKVSSFSMNDMTQSRTHILAQTKQDEAFSGGKKVVLGFYIFIIICIVAALVCIVIFAPVKNLTFPLKF